MVFLNGDARVEAFKLHKNNFAGNSFSSSKPPSTRKQLHEERKFNSLKKKYSNKEKREAKQSYESRKHCRRCGKLKKKFNCPSYKTFWQIKLSLKSSKLTVFNTSFGRFCFLKMLYRICSASEIFLRAFSDVFKDIEIYIMDITVC